MGYRTNYRTRQSKIEKVDPELARDLLNTNHHNRRIYDRVVARITKDIKDGNWKDNGQAISFYADGRLADGQHRLLAIERSGKTVEVKLEFGLADDCAPTIDCGQARSIANVLEMSGYGQNSTMLQSAINICLRYEVGRTKQRVMSNQDKYDWFLMHADLTGSTIFGSRCSKIMPRSIACALHYLFSQKDAVMADLFFEALASGANLNNDDPVYLLRQRLLMQHHPADGRRMNPIQRQTIEDLTIVAWNYARKGKKVRQLRTLVSGTEDEALEIL